MVRGVLELMRRQSNIPLETISASGLAAVLSFGHRDADPFELCGHVYAILPREVYNIVGLVSAVNCSFSVLFALGRCYTVFRREDHEHRTAHLVPCEGTYHHDNLGALYLRRWWVPSGFALFFTFPVLVLWCAGDNLPPIYVIFGFILAYRALNMLLATMRIIFPDERNSGIHKFIDILSVFVTDREYEAPEFENELCLSEEVSDTPSTILAEIANRSHAIITLDNGASLSIRNDRDVGLLGARDSWRSWFSPSPVRISKCKVVRIEKKYLNFRLIPVRVPFSIMWYSVYQAFEMFDVYRGAEDVDKCLIWLALVSILTELIITYIPGPCVAVKTSATDKKESQVICETSNTQLEE